MTYELNRLARQIQDKLESYQSHLDWLEQDRKRKYSKPEEEHQISQTVSLPELDTPDLTPEQIKEQYVLLGEGFLDETIAKLNKLEPSRLYENQTKKLPSAPPPKNHEEILRMLKKGDSIDSILLRFQGE